MIVKENEEGSIKMD